LPEGLNESIRRKEELLERLQRENKLLRELRRLDLIEKYGPSAETLSDEQLELLELEPEVSTSEVEAENDGHAERFASISVNPVFFVSRWR
jgi:transposase